MKGLEITLHRNKQFDAENDEEYKVIAGEHNATTVTVHFPSEYELYSKRVDFKNIRNEKWTVPLYTPEDENTTYSDDFDRLNFAFTIPSAVTVNGEIKMQFIAYLPDESETFVPFEIVRIEVQESVMYVKKKGSDNPDLILKAYENANLALEIARDSFDRIENAERSAVSAQESANNAESSAYIAQTNATNAEQSARDALTRATNAETSADSAENSARESAESASIAVTNSNNAVNTANNANTKSNTAVNTANNARTTANKAKDIIDHLSVSSEEIGSEDPMSVEITTDQATEYKNIKFNIPAPKQGTSYRNKGDWNSTTNYVKDQYFIDTVFYEGCTYFCKISNRNVAPVPSLESDYWGLLALKGSDAGITIIDNLDSDRVDCTLSANQGRVLKEMNCKIVKRQSDSSELVINDIVLVEV